MTDQESAQAGGWPALAAPGAVRPDAFAQWYDAWRRQYSAHCAAQEAERARMQRELRWMSGLIAAWSLVMGAAAVLAIWIVL